MKASITNLAKPARTVKALFFEIDKDCADEPMFTICDATSSDSDFVMKAAAAVKAESMMTLASLSSSIALHVTAIARAPATARSFASEVRADFLEIALDTVEEASEREPKLFKSDVCNDNELPTVASNKFVGMRPVPSRTTSNAPFVFADETMFSSPITAHPIARRATNSHAKLVAIIFI